MGHQQAIQLTARAGMILWLKWVLANAIGFALTPVPSFIVPGINEALGSTGVGVLTVLVGILIAIATGMLQWFVLRRYVRWANPWWLATSVGWIVAGYLASYIAFAALGARPSTLSFTAVTVPVNAALVGVCQWLVLRRHVRRAGWWVLANIAGWVIGNQWGIYIWAYAISFTVGIVFNPGRDPASMASLVSTIAYPAAIGVIAGSITGIALVWLLRQPHIDMAG